MYAFHPDDVLRVLCCVALRLRAHALMRLRPCAHASACPCADTFQHFQNSLTSHLYASSPYHTSSPRFSPPSHFSPSTPHNLILTAVPIMSADNSSPPAKRTKYNNNDELPHFLQEISDDIQHALHDTNAIKQHFGTPAPYEQPTIEGTATLTARG